MRLTSKTQAPYRFIAALAGLATLCLPFVTLAETFNPAATNQNTNISAPEMVSTPTPASLTSPDPIADLNSQIADKKARIDELNQQAAQYQDKINAAQGQIHDLKSQVAVIDDQVAQTNFQIQAKQEEISSLELEMAALQQSIDDQTKKISDQKDNLVSAVVQLDRNSRTSTLALVLTHDSLADFYTQAQATASLSQALSDSIQQLNSLRADLQAKQNDLTKARDDLQQTKAQLEVQKQSTVEQLSLKNDLLSGVQSSASQYDQLLQQSLKEEQQANATISALEAQLQQQLNSGDVPEPQFTSTGYIWPITSRDISAYFHDASYPFSCRLWHNAACMEHSGLDIRTPQGTPVRASADGIISVVHDQGFYTNADGQKTRSALNFVGILHQNGISTRYLHLSAVYVQADQFVKQGDIIGLSGGLPGTAGAGGMTTGAHVHFEVRVNGIPDDPLKYLPN